MKARFRWFTAVVVLMGAATWGAAQERDVLLDVDLLELLSDEDEEEVRVAQRPAPRREREDVLIRRAGPREGEDRERRESLPGREARPLPPGPARPESARLGPARLEERLAAVERKLDRILDELRRMEGRDHDRQPGPRPRAERLPGDRFGPPPRDPWERRPEGRRPQIDRFPSRTPELPPRERLGPPRRPERPSEDRFEPRPQRRPLPERPRPPRDRDWDRPDQN